MSAAPLHLSVSVDAELGPFLLQANLEVGAEPLALVGPNGSGKTSLLLAILGLLSCSIVLVETTNAKLRLFRVPEMLAVAFTLGTLALVSTFLF